MFFWFIGLSLWSVWFVFHDPAIDLRMVVLGAVLPDLLIVPAAYTFAHSMIGASLLLGIVMIATIGRRQIRRRAVFIPFGVLLHLVFDAAWSNTNVFWWPLHGWHTIHAIHPDRAVGIGLAMEAVGLLLTVAFIARFELLNPANRVRLIRDGRIPRLAE